MSAFLFIAATIALLVFINGLYVAAEFATVAARKTRVSQLAGTGNRAAQALLTVLEDGVMLDKYVAACQLGITASSLVLGAYGQRSLAPALTPLLTDLLGGVVSPAQAETLATTITATGVLVFITILQVVLGELTPKSLAVQYPEQVAMGVITPMRWSLRILRPFIWFFNGSGNLILRLLGQEHGEGHGAHIHSPEEIELLVTESHEGGLLDRDEQQMLRNAFRLRELHAQEVMVHRTRMLAMPVDSLVDDVLSTAIDAGYSRIPLYEESIDNIVGFVHIKDVYRLYVRQQGALTDIMRQVIRVPELLSVIDIWEKLQTRRQYVAVVFDEYGGTAGLITFEDLIEEVLGELQDEFDNETAMMSQSNGRLYLRSDVLVSDVNEYFGFSLPDENAVTVGGLVLSELGHPPHEGDVALVGEVEIRVEGMEDLGMTEVSIPLSAASSDHVTDVHEWGVSEDE
ncbi:MAG TPA: hemolysin family protein [Anaerolineae bacterium]|nr:hemolysin family protein [Anaerolineae bacterium]